MTSPSLHIAIGINRAAAVCEHAADPANLSEWAAGMAETPLQQIEGGGCEVVFALRRRPGMTEDDFTNGADAVAADL